MGGTNAIATVGDVDRLLWLWDPRIGSTAQLSVVASTGEVLSVDWSRHREHVLATSGKDHDVRIWDIRHASAPTKILKGHENEAIVVRWAPFRDDLLASGSSDCRLNIWDLAANADLGPPEGSDDDEDVVPELLFSHAGHFSGVSDISWSPTDEYLMCSVDEDNALQIWQLSTAFYMEESDSEPDEQLGSGEPLPKRPRGSED